MFTGHSALYILGFLLAVAVEFLFWALYRLHRETHKGAGGHRTSLRQLRVRDGYRPADLSGREKAGASSRPDWY